MYSDFDVIHTYSRKEAISDGVLVDLSINFPEAGRLFKHPVACTSAVWALVEAAAENTRLHNTAAGIVWDLLYMSINGVTQRISDSEHLFCVAIPGAGPHRNYILKANCGPSDDASPCITIMLEHED